MSIKTPNYVTTDDYEMHAGVQGLLSIPAGSFVKPINIKWVPKHVLDEYSNFDRNYLTFVYTRYGILLIPIKFIREV